MALQLETNVNHPVTSNCHILYDDLSQHCIVVDPGSENPSKILTFLESHKLCPDYIILTHEHFDHMWSCGALVEQFDIPIVCSRMCSVNIQDRKKNLSIFYNQVGIICPEAGILLEDVNWNIEWHGYTIRFFEAGGHSEGGVFFLIDKYLFAGDMLLKDIRTVTKLRRGSKEILQKSIELLVTFKGNGYLVCAGHGEKFELDHYDLNKAL